MNSDGLVGWMSIISWRVESAKRGSEIGKDVILLSFIGFAFLLLLRYPRDFQLTVFRACLTENCEFCRLFASRSFGSITNTVTIQYPSHRFLDFGLGCASLKHP